GRIQYTVLSFGGVLGIGDKLFAVPFEAFTIDQNDENFVLDVDQERLKNAPGFDKNDWPATGNTEFRDRVYAYYEIDPYWTATPVR
ncbi:MAG: PRC-barrel domain containing protein, partial [Chloroflexota bacterium]